MQASGFRAQGLSLKFRAWDLVLGLDLGPRFSLRVHT